MDARHPHRLRHAKSSGSVLHNATSNSQHEAQRLRPTKSSYFRRVIERPHDDTQQPRRTKSSYFKRSLEKPPDDIQSQKPRRTKSSYFRHTQKPSQDSIETKPHHNILSKIKAAFTKSHARNKSNTPSQLESKLKMTRLEYRLYAINHYSTPQQYHRIHLSAILFHPLTNLLLLIKDPIGHKYSIPETAMFTRHTSLGEALREGMLERTGLRISEVRREVLPVWEFEGGWKFGEGDMGMKSVMLNFVVAVEDLGVLKEEGVWVGEEEVEGLEMDRGMRNLVRWVFDERVCADW